MKKRVFSVRTRLVRESSVLYESKDGNRSIRSPEEAAAFAAPFFDDSDKEMIFICVLNAKKEPVSMEMTAKGAPGWCRADISQIYKTAILTNGSSILCFHNHPSGSLVPSMADVHITEKMKRAGDMLDIELEDHLIMGENGGFYSFREQMGGLWGEGEQTNE